MNADQFYHEFKLALNYSGVEFHQKHLVQVWLKDGRLWFGYGERQASLRLPTEQGEQK